MVQENWEFLDRNWLHLDLNFPVLIQQPGGNPTFLGNQRGWSRGNTGDINRMGMGLEVIPTSFPSISPGVGERVGNEEKCGKTQFWDVDLCSGWENALGTRFPK